MLESYPPILTKSQFVREYKLGRFGNASPTWDCLDSWSLHSIRHTGLFHIRNRVAGGVTYYNLTPQQVATTWTNLKDPSSFYISSMAPHHKNLIQGELLVDGGYYLTYSDEPNLPMRDALAKSTKYATGIMSLLLLRSAMCSNSWEWLQVLIERYPAHSIEVSVFSTYWGTLPSHNTCFWEVRKY